MSTIANTVLTAAAAPYPTGKIYHGVAGGPIIGPIGAAGIGGAGHVHVGGGGGGGAGGVAYQFTGNAVMGIGGGSTITIGTQAPTISLTMSGKPVPQGELFDDCVDLFLSPLRLDNSDANQHHFSIWIILHGDEFSDYGVVLRSNKGMFPAFGSETSRDQFTEWFETYKAQFYDGLDTAKVKVPTVKTGELHGIWFEDDLPPPDPRGYVTFKNREHGDPEEWAWIVSHCSHPVFRMANGWFFTNDADGLVFKMRK